MNQPHDPTPTERELSHMGDVDTHEWLPTEPDELAVLNRLFAYDVHTGTFHFQMGDSHG
jgi:hypothetical protein